MNLRIKEIRTENNLTQKDFGERLGGLKPNTISDIEKGKIGITSQNIKFICREFNINETWLINGTGDKYSKQRTFELDDYLKNKGASNFEIEIIKSYFDIDKEVRQKMWLEFTLSYNRTNDINLNIADKSIFEDFSTSSGNSQSKNQYQNSDYELSKELSPSNAEIEKELAAYRLELEAEQRGTTSPAFANTNTRNVKKAN